jgi:hypothetical protein
VKGIMTINMTKEQVKSDIANVSSNDIAVFFASYNYLQRRQNDLFESKIRMLVE